MQGQLDKLTKTLEGIDAEHAARAAEARMQHQAEAQAMRQQVEELQLRASELEAAMVRGEWPGGRCVPLVRANGGDSTPWRRHRAGRCALGLMRRSTPFLLGVVAGCLEEGVHC